MNLDILGDFGRFKEILRVFLIFSAEKYGKIRIITDKRLKKEKNLLKNY